MVDDRKRFISHVVVDRFGHAHHGELVPFLLREPGHTRRGVHRIVAADVEEITDIVCAQHIDDALEILLLIGF